MPQKVQQAGIATFTIIPALAFPVSWSVRYDYHGLVRYCPDVIDSRVCSEQGRQYHRSGREGDVAKICVAGRLLP